MTDDSIDPKGLIREAYAIDGITAAECRSIFLDWALSVPTDADHPALIGGLLGRYGHQPGGPGHPMTQTLTAGLQRPAPAQRRGGRAGRVAV